MPQIRPITDLRNTNEISDACHAVREPIFITKNGYGDLVVMSIETYEILGKENEYVDTGENNKSVKCPAGKPDRNHI